MVKGFLIDTNIFLEFLLRQERYIESFKFLCSIVIGEVEVYVTSFAVHSIEVNMTRKREMRGLKFFLEIVQEAQGLSVYYTDPVEEKEAVDIMEDLGLDFDDALHYLVAKKNGLTLVSFDQHFDKIDIKRVEPGDF